MNYKNIYGRLIQRGIARQAGKNKDILKEEIGYIEKHHIVPEFFFKNRKRKGPPGWLDGNPNDKDNLVFLTAKEHILGHLLLLKIYPDIHGLVIACINMSGHSDKRISIRLYEKIRIAYSQIVSDRFSGTTVPQERRDRISESLKGRPNLNQQGDKNVSKRPEVAKKSGDTRRGSRRKQVRDSIIFKFEHIKTGEVFEGTRQQFRSYTKISPQDLAPLINGIQKTSKGWKLPQTIINREAWNRDKDVYTIKELSTGKEYTGTRHELVDLCCITHYTIGSIVRKIHKRSNGWAIVESK